MKIYQVSRREESDGHAGFSYHASRREAEQAVREWCDASSWDAEKMALPAASIEVIEFEATRSGIIEMMNHYAAHNDNG